MALWCVFFILAKFCLSHSLVSQAWDEIPDGFVVQLKADYRKWLAGKEILREYQILLTNSSLPPSSFSCIFLPSLDHRHRICKLAQEFKVDVLVLGKHRPEDKRYRKKNWHRKTFRAYCKSNAHARVHIVE